MNELSKIWGIDLSGRKMRYEPWTTDDNGAYKKPSEKEIEEIYGISGEAVAETLLYFEQCGGNSMRLIELLNGHAPETGFQINREMLLDKNRWYNNEYYFYFIMFTKKVMGDYNWCFTQGENLQLSIYHKIYEHGFLKFVPYGGDEQDVNYSIVLAILKCYTPKGHDFSDYFNWVEALTKEKTSISFKDVISRLENYMLCSEFNKYLLELIKVSLNINNMITICHEAFDSYSLQSFSFVPEFMLIKVFSFITNKTGKFYEVVIEQTKNNSADFIFRATHEYNKNRDHIYQSSINFDLNAITLGAFPQIIKKLFKLSKMPEVKNINGQDTYSCSFTIEWEKRILSIPYLQLFIFNMACSILLIFNSLYKWNFLSDMLILSVAVNVILILLRLLKIERNGRIISNENLVKSNEDNALRLEEVQGLANELIQEKKELERKVEIRTKNLAEANERLKEIDIAKTNFYANISHELRTPLTLIVSPINEIIKGSYGSNINKGNPVFETMRKNSSRLLNLISNILNITKIEEGKMAVNNELIYIPDLIKIYISQIDPAVKNKGLYLKFVDNTKGMTTALIDQYLFESAMFNILSNALKFTEKGGITVVLENEKNNFISINISDTGIGIPDDKKDFIFERFRQVDENANRKYEGSGIGLALAKEVIEIFKGKISVESKMNEGTVFKIFLPIENNLKKEKPVKPKGISSLILDELKNTDEKKPVANDKRKRTILLVEDNKDLQNYISTALEENINVEIASNGVEALDKIRNMKKPSLIISDIMMPVMDGHELFRNINQMNDYNGIPFIFLSARADQDEKLKGLKSGAVDYIYKPFDIDELIYKVENLISKTENIKDAFKTEMHKKILNMMDENSNDDKFGELSVELKLKDYDLSNREKEIIFLLVKGNETKEIAGMLKINSHSVENHITSIYKKTAVSNKIELFNLLYKNN